VESGGWIMFGTPGADAVAEDFDLRPKHLPQPFWSGIIEGRGSRAGCLQIARMICAWIMVELHTPDIGDRPNRQACQQRKMGQGFRLCHVKSQTWVSRAISSHFGLRGPGIGMRLPSAAVNRVREPLSPRPAEYMRPVVSFRTGMDVAEKKPETCPATIVDQTQM